MVTGWSRWAAANVQPHNLSLHGKNIINIPSSDMIVSTTDSIAAMSQILSASFGPKNQGFQVGQNNGSINTEFHLWPGKIGALEPRDAAPR